MGRDSISSQEIGEYTNVNATQIRRDLSGFGKFGKRGVGYNIDYLIVEIRKILRDLRPAQHRPHRRRLPGPGDRAIAGLFADHGFNIAAVFDTDPAKIGDGHGDMHVQSHDRPRRRRSATATSSSACWRCPRRAAQAVANALVDADVKIIFNYADALIDTRPT